MAFFQAKQVIANKALFEPDSAAGGVHAIGEFVIPAGLANGDIVEMQGLPAFCVPTGCTLVCEDLDSVTGMTIDMGYLSGTFGSKPATPRTMGNEFFAASTVGQAGGFQTTNKFNGLIVSPATNEIGIGIKFVAVGTPIVGARVRVFLTYIAAPYGV